MPDLHHEPRGGRSFGSSQVLAGRLLLPAACILFLGLASSLSAKGVYLPGLALIALGGALLVVIVLRLAQRPVAAIELTTEGILYRDVGSRVIPWHEIRSIEISRVREVSAPLTREVASIAVSREFFAVLSDTTYWPHEVVSIGDPTLIHLGYYRCDVPARELADTIRAHLAEASKVPGQREGQATLAPNLGMRLVADRGDARPQGAHSKQQKGGFIENLLWGALAIAILLFIFGPVLGLRETSSQSRSRKIHEEHERRSQDSLKYSERERRRTEENLKRFHKEIFGDR